MKVLNNIKVFVVKVMSFRGLKYIFVCLLGVLIIGFLDENSVWSHIKNQRRIGELQEEIDQYNAQHNKNQAQIRKLNKDPKAMEKIARERYFMKADDEDIFVLSDDEKSTNTFATDESAE
ncbi:MAG: septum formation initiator family protein [Prevotella sp.]|nr:septum formation initiator family protein [Prevotella sp.]